MSYYDGKKKLEENLSKIFMTAKTRGQNLDMKKLVTQLTFDCSPLGELSVRRRIHEYAAAGKISIEGEEIVVV